MFRHSLVALAVLATIAGMAQSADDKRGLDVYFIDTEGGAATLIVTPAGESVLIDNGNPGVRDAERIHKTATELAGLKAIDHMIVTHWHSDHYGVDGAACETFAHSQLLRSRHSQQAG